MDERIFCPLVTDGKDLEITATGALSIDYTPSSRCRVRLLAKRGRWVYDPELGSRFWELKTLRQAQAGARSAAQEALEPLIAEGAILAVDVGAIEVDPRTGMVGVEVFVTLPSTTGGDEVLSVGTYKLGS